MQQKKEKFELNKELIHTVSKVSDEMAGQLFKHILGYVNDKNPQSENIIVNLLFTPIEHSLQEALLKKELFRKHCQEAGKKSAEQKKSTDFNRRQPALTNLEKPSRLKKKSTLEGPHQEILSVFNSTCFHLPKASLLTPKRKTLIDSILKTYTYDQIGLVFRLTTESDYLCGKISKWKASFDWLLNPNNFIKVLEGNYANITTASAPKNVVTQLEKASNAVDKWFKDGN
jgi:hypothetical protein